MFLLYRPILIKERVDRHRPVIRLSMNSQIHWFHFGRDFPVIIPFFLGSVSSPSGYRTWVTVKGLIGSQKACYYFIRDAGFPHTEIVMLDLVAPQGLLIDTRYLLH